MDCSLIIRSRNSIRRWNVDDWTALATVAALSAEPETEREFMLAIERYGIEHRLKYRGQKLATIPQMQDDATWCLIDLIGHVVIWAGDWEVPAHRDALQKDEDDPPGGSETIWFALPRDWIIQRATNDWSSLMEVRYKAGLSRSSRDARDVLWGCPLLDHLANGLLAASRDSMPNSEAEELAATRMIHAKWLMTARADLDHRTPRELLLEKHEVLDLDLFHRSQQWSTEGKQPRGLDDRSSAYRCAGFGTIQIVFYFDMIRSMLADGWRHLRANPEMALHELVEQLVQHQQKWLDTSNEETGAAMTPRRLMDCERKRIPVTTTEAALDCDCPLCQAQADGFFGASGVTSVGFMMFDAHHLELEEEFAFSTVESREEWEKQQQEDQESYAAISQQIDERQREASSEDSEMQSVWKSTFVNWNGPPILNDPFAEGAMHVGFCLCEIIGDLKRHSSGRDYLLRLNEAYRNFRRSDCPQLARTAAQDLCTELEEAASAFPDLVAKSADLQSHIHELMRSLE